MTPPDERRPLAGLAQRFNRRQERSEKVALLVSSALLDPVWIGHQLGLALEDASAAAAALLEADESRGTVSPHPLVELSWARPGQPWLAEGTNSVLWWLRSRNRREGLVPHPLLDLATIVRDHPGAVRHPGGPVGSWLAAAGAGTVLPTPVGYPTVTLGEVSGRASEALAEHQRLVALREATASPPVSWATPTVTSTYDGAPLVSVVMVVRDDARELRDGVRAVQEQTLPSWELLVVDDGSTDDSVAVLDGVAHFEPRVVPVPLGRVGPVAARNAALARARGRYLAFAEVGRPWRPEHLATATARLDGSDPATTAVVLAATDRGASEDAESLLARPPVDLAAVVARRDAALDVGDFDVSLGRSAADDWVLRLVGAARLPVLGYAATPVPPAGPDAGRAALLDRYLVQWPTAPAHQGQGTSVVVAVRDEAIHTVRWLEEAVTSSPPEVELAVVGGGLSRTHHVLAATLGSLSEQVTCHLGPVDPGLGTAFNLGLSRAGGRWVVLARAEAEARLPDLVALAAAADRDGVALAQPLVVAPDGTVASAGAAFATASPRPEPLLEGFSTRDARDVAPIEVAAPLGPVLAVRREAGVAVQGCDAACSDALPEVELGLRVRDQGHGTTLLVPGVEVRCAPHRVAGARRLLASVARLEADGAPLPSLAQEPWAALGFEVLGVRTEPLRDRPRDRPPRDRAGDEGPTLADPVLLPRAVVRPAPPRAVRISEDPPRLRWTIDTAVPAGPGGRSWGDLHFAESLATALERRGQHVAVDRRDARHRATRDHDDVVLTLRGLDRVPRRPGPVRVLWVISHPDEVDNDELAGYDATYAASLLWAQEVSARWGLRVLPLLQCTDTERFHPGLGDDAREPSARGPVLFVGNSRGVFRPALRAALATGHEVEVHGKGWKEFLGARAVASSGIDNAELGRAYAAASVVLNDHWGDMRRSGFLSNRLFDAGACGARILTDEIGGAVELFGPLVRTFAGNADVDAVLTDPDAAFGSRQERLARAAVIAAEHSFDRRAETLVDDAARLVRARLQPGLRQYD